MLGASEAVRGVAWLAAVSPKPVAISVDARHKASPTVDEHERIVIHHSYPAWIADAVIGGDGDGAAAAGSQEDEIALVRVGDQPAVPPGSGMPRADGSRC
jgi:hypothetical protein